MVASHLAICAAESTVCPGFTFIRHSLPIALQYVNYLTIPFEALLQHWNFTDSKLVVNVMDPDDTATKNQVNTGFMVFRNHAVVHAAIDAWWSCPERLADCAKYKDVLWAEQQASTPTHRMHMGVCGVSLLTRLPVDRMQAYSWFVFPTFTPDEVALANASEANGFPVSEGNPGKIAVGRLISHWWWVGKLYKDHLLANQ